MSSSQNKQKKDKTTGIVLLVIFVVLLVATIVLFQTTILEGWLFTKIVGIAATVGFFGGALSQIVQW
jgi:hypothetical protein